MNPGGGTGMVLKALVVDDESLARTHMRTLLSDCASPAVLCVGEAANAQDYLMQNGPFASVVQPGIYIATRANIGNYVYNPQWRVNPYVLSKS